MDRVAAYALVVAELEVVGRLPYDEVVARVAAEPVGRDVETPEGLAVLETRVTWRDRAAGSLDVVVTFYGPSTFRIERVEERICVEPPAPLDRG